ncbi:TlpA family protein disulfide reductase [Porticoccaceae bacterium]|nr:TlpA family protein disulfide reductase [Porticoccaceae bacterium]
MQIQFTRSLGTAIALLALLGGCGQPTDYPLHGGGAVTFDGVDQRWLMINYWAVWCAPCRKEIPELNQLAIKNDDRLILVGVNYDGIVGDELTAQMERLGVEFQTLLEDPRGRWMLAKTDVLPETLVIDQHGELRHRLVGPQTLESLSQLLPERAED